MIGNLKKALRALKAEPVYVPKLEAGFLEKGHACHFRCRAKEAEGKAKRYKTKLEKQKEEPKPEKKENKSSELDYGQKAFLTANGIKGKNEFEFTENLLKETGKDLEDLIEMKYYKTQLEDFRAEQKTKNATPSSSKRSSTSSRDNPEYWVNKPFNEVPAELKRKVLKLKEKKIESIDKFTSNPTIS